MKGKLLQAGSEAARSILPVCGIVLLLHIAISPLPGWTLGMFLVGCLLAIVGMALFSLGAEFALMPMGEAIGAELTRSRRLWVLLGGGFFLGVIVTLAEPDLQVLTKQVPAVPDAVLVFAVALGVGLFLVLALLRVLLRIPLPVMLTGSYALTFLAAALTAPGYLAVAFDSGGVTTGPVTVPFILSMGAGVSAVRAGKDAEADSFGLCALCSIGPVIAVLIMGMFFDPASTAHAFETVETVGGLRALLSLYGQGLMRSFLEVLLVLLPIVASFAFFQLIRKRFSRYELARAGTGIGFALFGLSIFLAAVNIGFLPVGKLIGRSIASRPDNWLLYPLGALLGFFIVAAEPAVHVLTRQAEELTSGALSRRMMLAGLCTGVALALVLCVMRALNHIDIWWFLLPGYALALGLSFFTPGLFTAVAFDSGGVAAGTMTAAFLLPFAVGISEAAGGSAMRDAFGVVALVAMMPLITVQCIGILYKAKLRRSRRQEQADAEAAEEAAKAGAEGQTENTETDAFEDMAQAGADGQAESAETDAFEEAAQAGADGQTENTETDAFEDMVQAGADGQCKSPGEDTDEHAADEVPRDHETNDAGPAGEGVSA